MFSFIRFKLSLKIFLSFLLIIIVPAVVSFVISYRLIKKTIEREIFMRLQDSISGYTEEIKFIEEKCLSIARELSRNNDIQQLYINKDYKNLEKKLIQIHKISYMDVVEIEDATGTVLLRGHNPSVSGDIKVNQNIIRVGLGGRDIVSYEKGRSGFAIRAVSPIKHDGKVLGLVMIGSLFSDRFVEHMKILTGMENGIYKDKTKIISTYQGYETLGDDVYNRFKSHKYEMIYEKNILLNKKEHFYMMLKPLFLKNGKYWGSIAMAISRSRARKYLIYSRNILVYVVLIGVSIAFMIYFLLARNINHSLKKIIDGINSVNLDNFSSRIELKNQDEFGLIAASINDLVRKLYLYNARIKKLQEDMVKSAKLTTAGQISAGIAHEIRNPLSSIKMMVQIIKSKYVKDYNSSEIKIILDEIDRINKLVKDLLEFSKPSPIHFIEGDINVIIRKTLDIFSYNIDHQNIKLDLKLNELLPWILIDAEKIQLVFINLIINAVQAMPEGGVLTIETDKINGNSIMISVCDTGIGIPEENLKNIFEPFFTTKKDGTGIGLALCKTIIERHKGTIDVSSNDSRTCFKIVLPIIKNKTMVNKGY